MDHVAHLRCLVCHEAYRPDEIDYVCPEHGTEGIVDVVYDYSRIGSSFDREAVAASPNRGMWRWRPLLPVEPDSPAPPLLVGDTPLYPAPRLAADLGLGRLWVKDDGRQPTASLKDRASAMAVVKAAEREAEVITTASTGNAAAALAGLCASVGRRSVIFVPASAPPAKVAQLLAYGATVMAVDGSYDQAFELCLAAERRYGWYNRNTGYNPYMSEGKKTVALEICEQLHWDVPDVIVVSVGDGCIIGGIHKGLRDLLALGWIDRVPRLIGVQAAGSNYLAEAWERGEDVFTKPPIAAHTVADSISAGLPRDRLKAMAAVVATGGAFVTVSDDEILAAIPDLARGSGVFAEPAAAAALSGLRRALAEGMAGPDDRVVVVSTGSGLKDVAAARRAAEDAGARPIEIAPDEDAMARAVADHRLAGEDEG
jgi:threonine synthase